MSLSTKLNLKGGAIRAVGRPRGIDLGDVTTTTARSCPNVLVFAATFAELDSRAADLESAARADAIAWVAYPKAGQLGTDMNRGSLWAHLEGRGIRPVRQVSIDDAWSALRFRPA